jgi:tRNA (guanine-N7-)-methyltransferase
MDWSPYYPAFLTPPESADSAASSTEENNAAGQHLVKDVEVADIGCGFGGLLVALAPKLPDTLLLGKLIRNSSFGQ